MFFTPARNAVLPDIVPRRDLLAANTLDETTQGTLDPIAYLVGGAIIAGLGVRFGFGVDSITFQSPKNCCNNESAACGSHRRASAEDSRTRALICLNSGVPAASHHSNKAASVVVTVAPAESIRRKAVA